MVLFVISDPAEPGHFYSLGSKSHGQNEKRKVAFIVVAIAPAVGTFFFKKNIHHVANTACQFRFMKNIASLKILYRVKMIETSNSRKATIK